MTQEDKELLFRDLCNRLLYGVICNCLHDYHTKASAIDAEDLTVYYPYCDEWESIEYCKPYLRSMSSMTEEEKEEYRNIDNRSYSCPIDYAHIPSSDRIDWLNKKMFDYRGLIPMGLAIEVTEENNPYK